MILEAFSRYLQAEENHGRNPEHVLYEWLTQILLFPPAPDDPGVDNMVSRVVHTEITMIESNGCRRFMARSESGNRLLTTLNEYCRSFDHWQFTRWLHDVQATDFSRRRA